MLERQLPVSCQLDRELHRLLAAFTNKDYVDNSSLRLVEQSTFEVGTVMNLQAADTSNHISGLDPAKIGRTSCMHFLNNEFLFRGGLHVFRG